VREAHHHGDGNGVYVFLGARAFLSVYVPGEGVVGQWGDAGHLPAGDPDPDRDLVLPKAMQLACLLEWIVLVT
jgi:hypothetical protein